MFGWLKRKAQLKIISTMEQDINRFIMGLKGASPPEVGMVVVFANHWRNVLERQFNWNLDHPDLVAATDIVAALRLNRMIREVQKKDAAKAAGLMVWLHTIRASETPEIRLLGREMWAQLSRGIPHTEQAADGVFQVFGVFMDTTGIDRVPENLRPCPPSPYGEAGFR